jgi:hypothetical protein
LAKGELKIEMGDSINGKGMIQVNGTLTFCWLRAMMLLTFACWGFFSHLMRWEWWIAPTVSIFQSLHLTNLLSLCGLRWVQGVSAVEAFHELLRQPSLSVMHPELNKPVAPVELCPILRALYKILIQR